MKIFEFALLMLFFMVTLTESDGIPDYLYSIKKFGERGPTNTAILLEKMERKFFDDHATGRMEYKWTELDNSDIPSETWSRLCVLASPSEDREEYIFSCSIDKIRAGQSEGIYKVKFNFLNEQRRIAVDVLECQCKYTFVSSIQIKEYPLRNFYIVKKTEMEYYRLIFSGVDHELSISDFLTGQQPPRGIDQTLFLQRAHS